MTETLGRQEALPCPFCGEQPVLVRMEHGTIWVKCENEKCQVVAETIATYKADEVIQLWNRRFR